ncbi:MAG: flagellar hook-associated protein FlgK [Burkholderiales bacterium]|nr:flagellar hook-associated protein FlgK [Burkholderiales bacterium]
MSIGVSALNAAYTQIQTAGNNIANANVAGYSRQNVQLATTPGQFTGGGFIGTGVAVQTVTRAHSSFLTTAAAATASLAAMDSTRSDQLTQLQQVFQLGQNGLGNTVNTFLNSFVDLASQPSDPATRQVVLSQASQLANQFNAAAGQIASLQTGVNSDLTTSVAAVNGLAQTIATLNAQIAAIQGTGQSPNTLLDQRDQAIQQLSSYVQVSTIAASDGSLGVFIGGGQSLVLGPNTTKLSAVPDAADSSRLSLAVGNGASQLALQPNALGGGSLAGLLNFQNNDLVQGRNLVGQLAASVAGAVNQQQTQGLSLNQPLGSVLGQPMFQTGAPLVLANANNKGSASIGVAVSDPAALQAADYTLSYDATGTYTLSRNGSPSTPISSFTSGPVVADGMTITLPATPPQPGDRFTIEPVGQAAAGMSMLLASPNDLAAASPLTATPAAANSGTATVASLTMNQAVPNAGASAKISFTNGSGAYNWTLTSSSGSTLSSGSGSWSAGQPIPTPPADINGFSLQLSGVPASGDVINVDPTPAANIATNNGNAQALAALRDAALVGHATVGGADTGSGGSTAANAYASAVATVGVKVQAAATAATMSASAASQAQQANSSVAGVNLDEEAAHLIQFQQSYQAAAKVLSVAQTVMNSLLQAVGAA